MLFKKKDKESKPKKEKKVPVMKVGTHKKNRDCLMAGVDCQYQLWGV